MPKKTITYGSLGFFCFIALIKSSGSWRTSRIDCFSELITSSSIFLSFL